MAESQLICLDDEHVNAKVPESKPEFYYSEEQRAALESLLRDGDGAFKMRLRADNVKDFLSAREVRWIRDTFREYEGAGGGGDSESCGSHSPRDPSADSGVHSTYWPTMSDTEVPPLDIGWPSSGFYRGVTRVSVYSHPPKENSPHIKEVVRRLIQESTKVVAVVMDLLTDLLILQDLLDAASKRGVAVYLLLEEQGLPHFLDMCSRLQISAQHLRNLRVRTVRGSGLALSMGRLPGALCSKYMLVDGEKVMFGSYSFTWTSSRVNRNTVTVMSGQVVEYFDNDFRELYAVSDKVDLYYEFHITKPPMPAPGIKAPAAPRQPALPVSSSRFQVSLGDSKQVNLKVPAHKYHNPKYALVVGNSLGITGSLQDLSKLKDYVGQNHMEKLLHTSGGSNERVESKPPQSPVSLKETDENKGEIKNPLPFGLKKQRSSFRLFLKGRSPSQSPDLRTANDSTDSKMTNHSPPKPVKDLANASKEANHSKEASHSKAVPSRMASHAKDPPKLANHAKEVPSKIANHAKEVPPKIADHAKEVPSRIASHAKEVPPKIANHAKEVPPTIADHAKEVPSRIVSHAKEVPPKIADHAKEVPPKIATQAKEVPPKIATQAKEVPPRIATHAKEASPEDASKHTQTPSPLLEVSESDSMAELDDTFVIIEKPNVLKFKNKSKSSKLGQRSMSLQTISTGEEDGSRGRRRNQKKTCIQS
ncbi:protein FAM83F [Pygocentrus nattereri]|uniref:Scaffolding anchor of CK1 domain-containing protein n=1 Tax=Pygocentrus nattereri TaxID=42514 RepID=A0A3B4EJ33_PYGNA|nr:protein FAM83F [Pygocentrus nattereri]